MSAIETVTSIVNSYDYGKYKDDPKKDIVFGKDKLLKLIEKETKIQIPFGTVNYKTTAKEFIEIVSSIVENGKFDPTDFAKEKIKKAKEEKKEHLGLASLGLEKLPEEIAELTHLTSLGVSDNNLKEIPRFVFQLNKLTDLDLSSNQLKTVPDEISTLPLEELHLEGNKLKEFPVGITKINSLKKLVYSC